MFIVLEELVHYCGVTDCFTVKMMVIGQTLFQYWKCSTDDEDDIYDKEEVDEVDDDS